MVAARKGWPSARTGICHPDGAVDLLWLGFYKDAAPTALR